MMRIRFTKALAATLSCAILSGGVMPAAYAQEAMPEAVAAEPVEVTGVSDQVPEAVAEIVEVVEAVPEEVAETPEVTAEAATGDEAEIQENAEILPEEEIVENEVQGAQNPLKLTADATYSVSTLQGYDEININGYTLTINGDLTSNVTINTGNPGKLIVNGNLTMNANLNAQDGWVEVKGNYVHRKGTLSFSSSTRVFIDGNMTFEGTSNISTFRGNGVVELGKNLVYSSTSTTSDNGATWNVNGNVTQTASAGQFRAGNLVLSGSGRQTLTLQSNSSVDSITPTNSNIAIVGHLNNAKLKGDLSPVLSGTFRTSKLDMEGHTLTINNSVETTDYISTGTNGKLIVNGNLTMGGNLSAQGGTVEVSGDYTHNKGTLSFNSATRVTVGGNMTFEGTSNISTFRGNGVVELGKDLVYSSTSTTSDNGATWNVKGNVTQSVSAGQFKAGNLVFLGSSRQTLTLQSNSAVDSITPTNPNIAINGPLNNTNLKGDLTPVLSGTFRTSKLELEGHTLTINNSVETTDYISTGTNGKLVVNGNLIMGGNLSAQGGTIEVSGDYTHNKGTLSFNSATRVTVGGNMTFEGTSNISTWNGNGEVTVGKNLTYRSTGTTNYNDTTWTVNGNVTQTAGSGSYNAGNITLPNAGSSVTLTNGRIKNLTLYDLPSKYTISPKGCYDSLLFQANWKSDKKGYWYFTSDGTYPKNGWQKVGKKWYYFDRSGYMKSGWQKIGGKWYYLGGKKDGSMKTGWQKIGKKWYYFAGNGTMVTGWKKVGGKWYYLNKSGTMKTGWLNDDGDWYYFDKNGAMVKSKSLKIKGTTYRFDKNGVCTNP